LRCFCFFSRIYLRAGKSRAQVFFHSLLMSTTFPHPDGSVTVRCDGCAPDFLTHLATHQTFLQQYFDFHSGLLDYGVESLRSLDARLDAVKQEAQPLPRALVDGLVAYCGEVVRGQTGGEWFMLVWPADTLGGVRYFPSIRPPDGPPLHVAPLIEDAAENRSDVRLYDLINRLTRPTTFTLPTQQWGAHPFDFPALDEASSTA
jgi:hypothetical protein